MLSIIFVHGLRGHPKSTWQGLTQNHKSKQGFYKLNSLLSQIRLVEPKIEPAIGEHVEANSPPVFWPEDLLPQTIPNALIMTYGYDADVVSDFFEIGGRSKNTISQHGQRLMHTLGFDVPGEV